MKRDNKHRNFNLRKNKFSSVTHWLAFIEATESTIKRYKTKNPEWD
jgi:hypothetical protein